MSLAYKNSKSNITMRSGSTTCNRQEWLCKPDFSCHLNMQCSCCDKKYMKLPFHRRNQASPYETQRRSSSQRLRGELHWLTSLNLFLIAAWMGSACGTNTDFPCVISTELLSEGEKWHVFWNCFAVISCIPVTLVFATLQPQSLGKDDKNNDHLLWMCAAFPHKSPGRWR